MDILTGIKHRIKTKVSARYHPFNIREFLEKLEKASTFRQVFYLVDHANLLIYDFDDLFGYDLQYKNLDIDGNLITDDYADFIKNGGNPRDVHQVYEKDKDYINRIQRMIDKEYLGDDEDIDLLYI